MTTVARTLTPLVRRIFGGRIPVRIRTWDGSTIEPDDGGVIDLTDTTVPPDGASITIVINSPDALRRMLYAPGELGLARAHVAGDIDVEGDIFALCDLRRHFGAARDHVSVGPTLSDLGAVFGTLRTLGALGRPLPPPREETQPRGLLHSRRRDAKVVRHHYDVSNEFYRLVLGDAMTYSSAYWAPSVDDLAGAQAAKHELICAKLGLRPGMRLLDVGCGWGSFLIHAARNYRIHGVGITLSPEQAALATERVAEAGLSDRITIRVQDYRDLDEKPFAAIASVGMYEHVGTNQAGTYAATLHDLLAPGGRLLNHAISRPDPRVAARVSPRSFVGRYVFPDSALNEVGHVVSSLQAAGLEVRDVESLREHYAQTLRTWVDNLQREWPLAQRLAGPGGARTWRLYMAGAAVAFEANRMAVHQVLAVRTRPDGRSGFPATRDWLAVHATSGRSEPTAGA